MSASPLPPLSAMVGVARRRPPLPPLAARRPPPESVSVPHRAPGGRTFLGGKP
jgi:hypothetical protein